MAGKTRARRPLNRQSSRKYDATPSSGTSPLASYKEAPPPPHPPGVSGLQVRPAVKLYSMKESLSKKSSSKLYFPYLFQTWQHTLQY